MTPDMRWPPQVGAPLPRAAQAYAAPEKLAWILSEAGHGGEWARVLRIGPRDAERLWKAIVQAVVGARTFRVNDSHYGTVCGANIELVIGRRSTKTTTSWHYEHALDAPRLVTAYPRS